MIFGATDISVILGQRGCGKSTLSRNISTVYSRRVVIDLLNEWDPSQADFITSDFSAFCEFLKTTIGKNAFTIVYQFNIDDSQESYDETFTQICRVIYKRGEITGENVAIVIEEVHNYATPHSINSWLFKLITWGRHANLAIIANSQRPASVHKGLISQASHVFVGQLFEPRDRDYLREFMSVAAERAATLEKFRFLHYRPGHVISEI